jgi:hypothetical protein
MSTYSDAVISIHVDDNTKNDYFDRELAKVLVEIWRARYNWTPEQIERIKALSKESYV